MDGIGHHRPRNLDWKRAAALLYGDWGTSKAYVIGLALFAAGYAALPHLLAICLVTAIVGVNYIWVCRCFANGGGVYTAAGMHSRRLAMVGGLLLLADFIVTASLSCLDAFHYLGFDQVQAKKWAITAIFLTGVLNFFGPKHTGSIAIWLALPVFAVVVILIAGGLPHLKDFHPQLPTGGAATRQEARTQSGSGTPSLTPARRLPHLGATIAPAAGRQPGRVLLPGAIRHETSSRPAGRPGRPGRARVRAAAATVEAAHRRPSDRPL